MRGGFPANLSKYAFLLMLLPSLRKGVAYHRLDRYESSRDVLGSHPGATPGRVRPDFITSRKEIEDATLPHSRRVRRGPEPGRGSGRGPGGQFSQLLSRPV